MSSNKLILSGHSFPAYEYSKYLDYSTIQTMI